MFNLNNYSGLIKLVLLIAASIALLYVIGFSLRLLLPFFLALILSAIVRPVAKFLRRRFFLGRTISIWFAMIVVLGLGFLIVFYLLTWLLLQVKKLSLLLPAYTNLAKLELARLTKRLSEWFGGISPDYTNVAQKAVDNLGEILSALFSKILEYLVQFSSGLPDALLVLAIAIVATFFISRDYDQLKTKIIEVIPEQWRMPVLLGLANANTGLLKVLKVNGLLFSISFAQMMFGFWLLGLKHYMLAALFITFVDIMPIVGLGLVFVPWIIWSFIAMPKMFSFGLFLIYIICVGTRQFLQPKLYADTFDMDPLAALLAIYVGWQMAGFWGLIFGPMLLMLVLMFYRQNGWLLQEMFKQFKS